jgi:folylpolyglutamate synthase/dihydropteroate synthase
MEAMQAAATAAHKDDMILVCGSVFIVGEIEPANIKW